MTQLTTHEGSPLTLNRSSQVLTQVTHEDSPLNLDKSSQVLTQISTRPLTPATHSASLLTSLASLAH
jgi:hypothetical protein